MGTGLSSDDCSSCPHSLLAWLQQHEPRLRERVLPSLSEVQPSSPADVSAERLDCHRDRDCAVPCQPDFLHLVPG